MIIFNQDLITDGEYKLSISNRSFRFGDGCFETIRLSNGKASFLEYHHQRLLKTLDFLKIDVSANLSFERLNQQIEQLAIANQLKNEGHVRLTVFRNDGGMYFPKEKDCSYILEIKPLPAFYFSESTKAINLGIYIDELKPRVRVSNFKTNNCLLYILASIYADSKAYDDCLLINDLGNIVESSNSNLFAVFGDRIITPPLSEGCLDGVTRRVVKEILKEHNCEVVEAPISQADLPYSDEIILTNALRGPRWAIGQGKGGNQLTLKLSKWWNDYV